MAVSPRQLEKSDDKRVEEFLSCLDDPYWGDRIQEQMLERIYEELKEIDYKSVQDIPTPSSLCYSIIDKLKSYTDLQDKSVLVLNIEFLDYLKDVEDLYFFADDELKKKFVNYFYPKVKVINGNFLELEFNMKFDVIVGNPPYQGTSGNKGSGNILWDKFAILSFDKLISDSGYVCLVHPSLWRKPNHKLRAFIKNLIYLEIHSDTDGKKMFGAQTRFDWYVGRKTGYEGRTTVKDQYGVVKEIEMNKWDFIPNAQFDFVMSLVAKCEKDRAKILNSQSAYEPRKNWMSDVKTRKFRYPCVYMVRVDGTPVLKWSNRKDKGHFGIPKVIYGSGVATGILVDTKGEYGLTQWASGIVAPIKELSFIAKAIASDKFQRFREVLSMSKIEINTHVLRLFRKDFWKEFI